MVEGDEGKCVRGAGMVKGVKVGEWGGGHGRSCEDKRVGVVEWVRVKSRCGCNGIRGEYI